jgi:Tfp pilus assembly protein PilZ
MDALVFVTSNDNFDLNDGLFSVVSIVHRMHKLDIGSGDVQSQVCNSGRLKFILNSSLIIYS